MSGLLSSRPEVAVVTDTLDMSLNVNHAVSRHDSRTSPHDVTLTESSADVALTRGDVALTLPRRVAEARSLSNLATFEQYATR